ncbi:MAG: leucyl aminopeptidase [Zetaproteobacteria bacterium]|nr:leucyl aminopeptidase [Zetaproteobacteria bacterium]
MINIEIGVGSAHEQVDDGVVLPVLKGGVFTASGENLRNMQTEIMDDVLKTRDIWGNQGEYYPLYRLQGTASRSTMLLAAGDEKKLTLHVLRSLSAKLTKDLSKQGVQQAACYLAELPVKGASVADKVQAIGEGAYLGLYTFNHHQTTKKESTNGLQCLRIMLTSDDAGKEENAALVKAKAVALGTIFARNLGNEPGNICTPEWLGEQALSLSHPKLNVTVMDKEDIEEAGFTALLAVNQGSAKEPRFIVLNYQGGKKDDAPVALVGKGLTFDAGGISIKPSAAMDEMKFDMCGSAAVLGIFKAITDMNLPINVLGVIPSTENLLGAAAYKPGDVITSYQGTTIEVLNTDAEGRVILCDALAYAVEQKPCEIIDFATLTGACVVALGGQATGLLGTGEAVKEGLKKSGRHTHDRVWELPLFEEYQEQIDSKIADIKNTGGREAGTITAACFLSRFVGDVPWAHLDIAGTAWNMKGTDISPVGGATGAGVRLVVDYLSRKIEQA